MQKPSYPMLELYALMAAFFFKATRNVIPVDSPLPAGNWGIDPDTQKPLTAGRAQRELRGILYGFRGSRLEALRARIMQEFKGLSLSNIENDFVKLGLEGHKHDEALSQSFLEREGVNELAAKISLYLVEESIKADPVGAEKARRRMKEAEAAGQPQTPNAGIGTDPVFA